MSDITLGPALAAAPPGEIGVAVSGGGDSVALLLLLREAGHAVAAVTIDHGLRDGSAAEASSVAALCAAHGIPHETRIWAARDGVGNLQDRARQARRALIADWARGRGIAAVALGHTLDDQAETFLLRLARGSGADGLSAMAPVVRMDGITWLRPLLAVRRAVLRDWLGARGVAWADDPSNEDARFDRVRMRAALPLFATLGLGPERLAATAARLRRVRTALEQATAELARACLTPGEAGDVGLDPRPLADAAEELQLRLLSGALCWVSGEPYRPREERLQRVLGQVLGGEVGHGVTFHGCVLRVRGGGVVIRREPSRVAGRVPLAQRRWDGRWELTGAGPADGEALEIGAVGTEGLRGLPDWPSAGPARETLLTTPAVWRGATLVAAPLARPAAGFEFRRVSAIAPPWQPEIMR